jgi:hypothetical protein
MELIEVGERQEARGERFFPYPDQAADETV